MGAQNTQPVVSGSGVAAAGVASATAALITSRFGVAGTLIGAAITTMIITGGSAVLKSYLEGVTGRVRKVPGKVRQGAGRIRNRNADEQQAIPARPDLRNNFMGRLRGAFDWFLHLTPLRRRAILAGAVVPAVIAFLISMGAVTALEVAIGNSLPCGIWNKCPVAADGSSVTGGTRPTLFLGKEKAVDATQDQQVPGSQQLPSQQNGQQAVDPNVQPEADPGAQQVEPQQPATPDPAIPDVEPQEEAVEPAPAPAPAPAEEAAPPAQEVVPAPSE